MKYIALIIFLVFNFPLIAEEIYKTEEITVEHDKATSWEYHFSSIEDFVSAVNLPRYKVLASGKVLDEYFVVLRDENDIIVTNLNIGGFQEKSWSISVKYIVAGKEYEIKYDKAITVLFSKIKSSDFNVVLNFKCIYGVTFKIPENIKDIITDLNIKNSENQIIGITTKLHL